MTIAENVSHAEGTAAFAESLGAVAFGGSVSRSTTIPPFIPAGEAYYWSVPWQNDVRESLAALRAGEFVDFDSDDPADVARWLLSVDDEE